MAKMPADITVKVKDEAGEKIAAVVEKLDRIEIILAEMKQELADYLKQSLVAEGGE